MGVKSISGVDDGSIHVDAKSPESGFSTMIEVTGWVLVA
jgi:hypothetical protein